MHSAALCELSKVTNKGIKLTKVQAEKLNFERNKVINKVIHLKYAEYAHLWGRAVSGTHALSGTQEHRLGQKDC